LSRKSLQLENSIAAITSRPASFTLLGADLVGAAADRYKAKKA